MPPRKHKSKTYRVLARRNRTARPRGLCSICQGEFALKTDGTVRGHGWRGIGGLYTEWCKGSWLSPKTKGIDEC